MKKNRKLHPALVALVLLVLASLACNLAAEPEPAPIAEPTAEQSQPVQSGGSDEGLSRTERERLISATVQIKAVFEEGGDLNVYWTGSGTIISPDGIILTNSHVAAPAAMGYGDQNPDLLAIGLVESEDKPPVFSYFAEVRAVDGYLDLAVLQIVSTLDGDSLDPSDLNLPYVDVGNSDNVRIGDNLSIFGFPGIGGETITFTDGNVSGFTAEDAVGDRAWIKTDATISGGNSGGLGADDNGQIVGVPTIASSGANTDITDCRVVQDTNGDGQLNQDDTCIPIGGFINALRPIKLAMPLIRAAQKGAEYVSPYNVGGVSQGGGSSSGEEQFGEVTWVTLDKNGDPDQTVSSYPSGAAIIAATFPYGGMTDGQPWKETWYYEDEVTAEGEYAWEYGESGSLTIYLYNTDDSALADGVYRVDLFAGDGMPRLATSKVTVGSGSGSSPEPAPVSSGVSLYGKIVDNDTQRGIPGAFFIVLKPKISYADWEAENFPDDMIYSYVQSDKRGDFQLLDLVERNTKYTVVIAADGYQVLFYDDQVFTDDDPDEFDLTIPLNKQ